MCRFSELAARWAAAFCGLVLLLSLSFCATVPSSGKHVTSVPDLKNSQRMDESFQALWEKRTVYFGQERMGGNALRLGLPFMMSGKPGGDSEFPIQITATWMDSLLIEAGLKHYASLLAMTAQEEREFRNSYFQRYDVEKHLLIWCELQTSWAELHLDLDRWTIFIEDDAGSQYEPLQILEESQHTGQTITDMFPDSLPGQRGRVWEFHQKTIMLCFPKFDFYKKPILSEEVQFLKLVFLLSDDPQTRSEGIWRLKS